MLKLRKSVTNHWVYGSHGLASRGGEVWGGGGRGGGVEIEYTNGVTTKRMNSLSVILLKPEFRLMRNIRVY